MRVPTINELQDLWVYKRVNQYYDEHRPAPDHSLFIAEFRAAIDRAKAEAWDEGFEGAYRMAKGYGHVDHWMDSPDNPYRKQEEA